MAWRASGFGTGERCDSVSTHDRDGAPPDPEPSDQLIEMLASGLEQGAPLEAPHPSQARYRRLTGQAESRQPLRRTILAFAAGAPLMSLTLLLARARGV